MYTRYKTYRPIKRYKNDEKRTHKTKIEKSSSVLHTHLIKVAISLVSNGLEHRSVFSLNSGNTETLANDSAYTLDK